MFRVRVNSVFLCVICIGGAAHVQGSRCCLLEARKWELVGKGDSCVEGSCCCWLPSLKWDSWRGQPAMNKLKAAAVSEVGGGELAMQMLSAAAAACLRLEMGSCGDGSHER